MKEAVSQMESELKKTKTSDARMETSRRSQWGLASVRTRLNIKEDVGINQGCRLSLVADSILGATHHRTGLSRGSSLSSVIYDKSIT